MFESSDFFTAYNNAKRLINLDYAVLTIFLLLILYSIFQTVSEFENFGDLKLMSDFAYLEADLFSD